MQAVSLGVGVAVAAAIRCRSCRRRRGTLGCRSAAKTAASSRGSTAAQRGRSRCHWCHAWSLDVFGREQRTDDGGRLERAAARHARVDILWQGEGWRGEGVKG